MRPAVLFLPFVLFAVPGQGISTCTVMMRKIAAVHGYGAAVVIVFPMGAVKSPNGGET